MAVQGVARRVGGMGLRRYMSNGPSVVDQMITYARGLKGQDQQAVDILRSGLGMEPDPAQGAESSRLLLALSEVAANQNQWSEAAGYAERAASAATASSSGRHEDTAAELVQAATLLQVRALLATGADDAAKQAVEAAAAGFSRGGAQQPALMGCSLVVQHALCDAACQATAQQLRKQLADSKPGGVLDSWAWSALGHHELSQGEHDAANKHYGEAASAARDTAVAAAEQQPQLLSASFALEIEADALAGQAQVSITSKQWEDAEQQLGDALSAAERAGGEGTPRLVPALLLLGYVYARSARVMYAEGMFREAAKLAHLDPSRATPAMHSSRALHSSLASALAWRYCQLLTALPRRSNEAAAWGELARGLWYESGCLAKSDIAAVLGDDVGLKGQGNQGQGGVVSMFLRRVLP